MKSQSWLLSGAGGWGERNERGRMQRGGQRGTELHYYHKPYIAHCPKGTPHPHHTPFSLWQVVDARCRFRAESRPRSETFLTPSVRSGQDGAFAGLAVTHSLLAPWPSGICPRFHAGGGAGLRVPTCPQSFPKGDTMTLLLPVPKARALSSSPFLSHPDLKETIFKDAGLRPPASMTTSGRSHPWESPDAAPPTATGGPSTLGACAADGDPVVTEVCSKWPTPNLQVLGSLYNAKVYGRTQSSFLLFGF